MYIIHNIVLDLAFFIDFFYLTYIMYIINHFVVYNTGIFPCIYTRRSS